MLRMKDKLGEGTSVPLGYVVTTLPDLDYPPRDYFTWKRKKLLSLSLFWDLLKHI